MDTLGKLRIIHNRKYILEMYIFETRALGWDCVWLGCWRGNSPPSLWSVRALSGEALRGNLRHYSQPYGVQQSGIFCNARKRDKASQSVSLFEKLLPAVKRLANKDWARPVPAAAVIPAVQVAANIIGSKTSVACLISFLWNSASQASSLREILFGSGPVDVRSTVKVVVKYVNLDWTNNQRRHLTRTDLTVRDEGQGRKTD